MRDIHPNEVKTEFFERFNQGDSVYREGVPFADFVKESHVLYKRDAKADTFDLVPSWPDVIGLPGFYMGDGRTNKATRVVDAFGRNARTKLDMSDIELWVAFWAILDILDGAGVGTHNNDSRIPTRDMFLVSYDIDTIDYEFICSNSKLEVEKELQMMRSPHYCLLKWLRQGVEEWINQDPDHLYSVNFNGPYITIDRMTDIKTLAFHAMKENHPILKRLEQMNLI